MRTIRSDFHQRGTNAFSIRSRYETVRPRVGAASVPRTLSVALTSWRASGRSESSFFPSSRNVRPSYESSGFVTGPTACDASEAFARLMRTSSSRSADGASRTRAFGSREPNGLTPLNSLCARPSQNWRLLNTALMVLPALRGETRRTFTPPTLKVGSAGRGTPSSSNLPGTMPPNVVGIVPCEDVTAVVSDTTAEAASFGFASLWNGKSAAVRLAFGPRASNVVCPPAVPGFSWFRERLSAPASKWQVAQAWMPSLPTCMSQNSDLPRAIAACLSRMKSPRFGGSGTVTELSGASTGCGAGAAASDGPTRIASSAVAKIVATIPGSRRRVDIGLYFPLPFAQMRTPAAAKYPDRTPVGSR